MTSEAVKIARAQWLQNLGLALLAGGLVIVAVAWGLLGASTQIIVAITSGTAVTNFASIILNLLNSANFLFYGGLIIFITGVVFTIMSYYLLPN